MKQKITKIMIGSIIVFTLVGCANKQTENILYSSEAITIMKEQEVYDTIKKKEYNKTVETFLEQKAFQKEYLEEYYQIDYVEEKDFTTRVNTLLDKSYKPEEINIIFKYLNEKNISKLLDMEYQNITEYVQIPNVEVDKIDRYNAYKEKENLDINTAVTYVNIGLDLEYYSQIQTIEDPSSYTVLLNKYRALPEDYVPDDLTSLSINPNMQLRKEAAEHYEQLQDAALLDNVRIIPFSAYRSKTYQTRLYNNYVNSDGLKNADTYSARPRHSEHELGLAIDVRSSVLLDNLTDNDYQWMQNNSYKYGFIIRYAKGTTPITGYIEEPWHLRYVGIDIATDVHEKNITYDEYYDLYLKETEKN